MKILSLALLSLLLTGCATVDITEQTFLVPDERPPAPAALGAGYTLESVSVTHGDNVITRGVYYRTPQAHVTVLYFGGNGFHLDQQGNYMVQALAKTGVNIVAFDYRGYGQSDGTPTANLLAADGIDLCQYVRSTLKPADRLVLYGFSLGSFVAAHVAQTQPIDGLVLESAPTNVQDLTWNSVPWLVRPYVHLRFAPELAIADNVKSLNNYTGPLLLLYGAKDEGISDAMRCSLYDHAKSTKKQIHVYPDEGHYTMGNDQFPAILRDFLTKQVGG